MDKLRTSFSYSPRIYVISATFYLSKMPFGQQLDNFYDTTSWEHYFCTFFALTCLMFRHIRQNPRDRFAAMYIIVLERMSIYRKSYIGSRMTCTL